MGMDVGVQHRQVHRCRESFRFFTENIELPADSVALAVVGGELLKPNINAKMSCAGVANEEHHTFQIPAIAIECKTYLDKTMLEGSSTAAEQLKHRNPNALYFVVAEWLKLTEQVNLRKFKVDQIYVLRKQKNTDREYRYIPSYQKNPVYIDVVQHLFNSVRNHLTIDWESGVNFGLQKGYLL